jgi:hypothetical protein
LALAQPYLPPIVSFIGLIAIIVSNILYDGLSEWIEQLFVILSMLCLIIDYYRNGFIHYWSRQKKRNEISFLVTAFILLFLLRSNDTGRIRRSYGENTDSRIDGPESYFYFALIFYFLFSDFVRFAFYH